MRTTFVLIGALRVERNWKILFPHVKLWVVLVGFPGCLIRLF